MFSKETILSVPEQLPQYQIADIEDKNIFFHEYIFVLYTQKPIKKNHLVLHNDLNTLNNNPKNLFSVDVNDPLLKNSDKVEEINDFHQEKNKIFHEDQIETNKEFLRKHFKDVFDIFFPDEKDQDN